MIKVFSGIGQISHPFDVEGQASAATIERTPFFGSTNAHIVVDHVATPVLGNLGNPGIINKVFPTIPSPVTVATPPSSLPSPLSSNPSQAGPSAPPFITVTPQVTPQVMSQESGPASYDTLFHEFYIDVYPTYNFWVTDEETNDRDSVGDRKLEDIPRYNRIVWDPTPNITRKYGINVPGSVQQKKSMTPVMFGTEIMRPKAIMTKGITFVPEHLNNFQLVKESLSNGFVSPGTVHAIVELSHNNSAGSDPIVSTEPYHYIDEDAFLQHPDMAGVSLEEIKANVHSLTNGVLYSGKLAAETVSADMTTDQSELFSGKFSVEKPPTNGGFMNMQGVHSAGPPLSFRARTSTTGETPVALVDPVLDLVDRVQSSPTQIPESDVQQVRAKFVAPILGGLLAPEKINTMQRPEHAESMAAMAQFLPNLEVMNVAQTQNKPRQIEIPSFPSPPDLPYLEYVGYVIEKYEKGESGAFILRETIDIPHPEYSSYVDSKIKYGSTYRYRIRSIIRWTRPSYMGVQGPEPTLGAGHTSQTRAFSFYRSSYFHSEWSKTWAYGMVIDTVSPTPPDELQVRPDSARKRVVVSFKLPLNTQRDIYYMRLFRKLQDETGSDLTGWVQVGSNWGAENVLYFDTDVDFFQKNHIRYIYCAQTITRHNEYSPLSTQLGARLNQDFGTYGEYPIEFVSQPGVRLEHHGAFATYPFQRQLTEVIVPNDSQFYFAGRSANGTRALDDAQYYVRIESLDTGEKKDYPIMITYNNQPTVVDRKGLSVLPSNQSPPKSPITVGKPMPDPVFRNWGPTDPIPKTVSANKPSVPRRSFGPSGIR